MEVEIFKAVTDLPSSELSSKFIPRSDEVKFREIGHAHLLKFETNKKLRKKDKRVCLIGNSCQEEKAFFLKITSEKPQNLWDNVLWTD